MQRFYTNNGNSQINFGIIQGKGIMKIFGHLQNHREGSIASLQLFHLNIIKRRLTHKGRQ